MDSPAIASPDRQQVAEDAADLELDVGISRSARVRGDRRVAQHLHRDLLRRDGELVAQCADGPIMPALVVRRPRVFGEDVVRGLPHGDHDNAPLPVGVGGGIVNICVSHF